MTGAPIITTATASSPPGFYPITLETGTLLATNYTFAFQSGSLIVTPVVLTLTALNQTRTYGDINPGFAYSVTGFVGNDFLEQSELSGAPVFATTATGPSSSAGTYIIVIGAGTLLYADPNYVLDSTHVQSGKLTITPAPLTVTTNSLARPYGQENPALKPPNFNGFVNGETLATSDVTGSPSVSTTTTADSLAGSYPIVVARGSLSSSNYTFTFQSGTLTITPVVLTVTAGDATRPYGAVNPVIDDTITGFVNGETIITSDLTGSPSNPTATTSTSPVGTYPITPAAGTLKSKNYTFSFQPGTLTITPAPLTVAAVDATRGYGITNLVLGYTLTGFANGETALTGGVTGAPDLVTTAQANSPLGTYPIFVGPGSLSATNYVFQGFLSGTLKITQASLIVKVQDANKSYGAQLPAFTYTVVREDQPQTSVSVAEGGLTGSPVLTTTAVATSPMGSYPITAAPGTLAVANTNYSLDFAHSLNGTLTIGQAGLTITASYASRAYGAGDPSFTYTISGYIGGTNDVTGTPSFTTTAVLTSHVGDYSILPDLGSLQSQLYSFAFAPGVLAVTPAPLTIAANSTSQSLGVSPRLTASYIGLVNGDTAASLVSPAILTTTATSSSPAGTYPITVSGATSPDYHITFVPGTLTVSAGASTSRFLGPLIRAAVAPPVTFVVSVAAAGPALAPLTGVVTFYDGKHAIGVVAVVNGTATLTTSALAKGNHSIYAVYEGDANYSGSSAGPVSQMVFSTRPAVRATRAAPIHLPAKKKTPPPKHPLKKASPAPAKVNAPPHHPAAVKPAAKRKAK